METALLEDFYLGRRQEFVEIVEWFRKKQGMRKAELVRRLGEDLHPSNAKRWIAIGPPFKEIWRFEKALGVPARYLIMRQAVSNDLKPADAELLLLWSYLDRDVRASILELIRTISLRGDRPLP